MSVRPQTWLGVCAVAIGAVGASATSLSRPPNLVLILMDDMGWTDAAVLGSDFYETPSIDRLRREGMLFTDAYANAPNCSPSRASLMTGLYPPRHGILTVGSSERGTATQRKLIPVPNEDVLAPRFVTIAEILRDAGYRTFIGGKWNLGDGAAGPEQQGFELNVGGTAAGKPDTYFAPWKNPKVGPARAGTHLGDYITDRAIEFIRAERSRAFFAYIAYYDVHTPFEAKPELIQKYRGKLARLQGAGLKIQHDDAVYAAMIETADAHVGRVVGTLNELGIEEETLVVLFSDNGGYGDATHMRPLRGSKGMLYEGGIRGPLIVRWPGRIAANATSRKPVMGADFFPTFRALSQASSNLDIPLDGIDLSPVFFSQPDETSLLERALFWHCPVYLENRPQKTPDDSHDGIWRNAPSGAVRSGDWKLIEYFEDDSVELFDLRQDIGERNNLVTSRPDKVAELRALLSEWRTKTGAAMPSAPNPLYRP
jgi:arylsulfatase A-like enzyme